MQILAHQINPPPEPLDARAEYPSISDLVDNENLPRKLTIEKEAAK